jgi:hypothetical protein
MLICGAMLCGLIQSLFQGDSGIRTLVTFAAGLLMVIVAISPFLKNQDTWLDLHMADYTATANAATVQGHEYAQAQMRQIIIEKTQTYILDKAAAMGAEISAQVQLSDGELPYPESVTITGAVSPYVKKQLTHMLQTDLAVTEDHLQWN